MRTESVIFSVRIFLRTKIDMLSTHIGIRQNALLPLNSTLHLQRQKETNEQVRIASVVT